MKRYNTFDNHMVLIGIIVPFLLFFISMHSTYAYFTATATVQKSTASTATVQITLDAVDDTVEDHTGFITSSSQEGVINNVLPGDTVTIGGTLVNSGTADCYAILKFTLDVTITGSSEVENLATKYYTFTSQGSSQYTQTEITTSSDTYSANAGIISAKNNTNSDERDFSIPYTFTGANFGNEYQGGTISYSIKAYAIQTVNIASTEAASAVEATKLLMQYINE